MPGIKFGLAFSEYHASNSRDPSDQTSKSIIHPGNCSQLRSAHQHSGRLSQAGGDRYPTIPFLTRLVSVLVSATANEPSVCRNDSFLALSRVRASASSLVRRQNPRPFHQDTVIELFILSTNIAPIAGLMPGNPGENVILRQVVEGVVPPLGINCAGMSDRFSHCRFQKQFGPRPNCCKIKILQHSLNPL